MIRVKVLENEMPQPQPQPPTTSFMPLPPEPEPEPTLELEPNYLEFIAQKLAKLGASVSITGMWVWAEFGGKPDNEILSILKSMGCIWCRNKRKWAYRGVKSHSRKTMPWNYITNKYGEKIIREENESGKN